MAQASLQWAPAYCLNKKRFKFQLNQMSDDGRLEPDGERRRRRRRSCPRRTSATSDDPVGYAPTAVTGFAIGYNIDRPDNAGRVHRPAGSTRGWSPSC